MEKKEQKKLLCEVIKADEKDGLYEIEKYEYKRESFSYSNICTEICPANKQQVIGSWECDSKCPHKCTIDTTRGTIQCKALNEALKNSK